MKQTLDVCSEQTTRYAGHNFAVFNTAVIVISDEKLINALTSSFMAHSLIHPKQRQGLCKCETSYRAALAYLYPCNVCSAHDALTNIYMTIA
jgi:hypothetical protein